MARMTPSDDPRHTGLTALRGRDVALAAGGPGTVRPPYTPTPGPIGPVPASGPLSASEQLHVRRAGPGDLDTVVALFDVTYPDSVWARIGRAAIYFDRYSSGPDICLIATLQRRVVGVTYGSSFDRDSLASLGRSHGLALARAVLAEAIQRPRILRLVAARIPRALSRKGGWRSLVVPALADAAHGEVIAGSDICVVHVFVGQDSQGSGVGTALLNAFFSVMGEARYGWCIAHTKAGSGRVHRLNERVGLHRLVETGNDVVWARRLDLSPAATA